MLRIIGCIAAVVFSSVFSYAQQALTAAGGKGTGSEGSASYTAGQGNNTSLKSSAGTVMEGIQLPFEIHIVTNLDPVQDITLECEAYPNPATDFLILKINRDQIENMKYQLFNLNGKILEEAFIGDAETTISLKHYKPTNYLLKVLDNTQEVMTFKITKTNRP